jgi:anti-sigma factor RsiW
MKTKCAMVRSLTPAGNISALSSRLDSHLGECLACQAEVARYRKLRRQLASLGEVVVPAPASLVAAVERALATNADGAAEVEDESHPAHVAAAAGAVVAAAGAVAVAVWRHSKAVV